MNKTNPSTLLSLFCAFLAAFVLAGCSKPEMPVVVTYRKAMLDNSLVAQFHNNSERYLTVVVKFENRTLNQQKSGYIKIGPRENVEIGWTDGWKFMSGEYITLTHEDYNTQVVRIP